MTINISQPTYLNFLRNEIKTLIFLFNNTYITDSFFALSQEAKNAYYKYDNIQHKHWSKIDFDFRVNFNLEVEKDFRRIIIEANVILRF